MRVEVWQKDTATETTGSEERTLGDSTSVSAAFAVIVAGTTVMTSAPPRPSEHPPHVRGCGPDEMPQEVTDFGEREVKWLSVE
jgi:hypothetical protein